MNGYWKVAGYVVLATVVAGGYSAFVGDILVGRVETSTGRGGSIDFWARIYFTYASLLLIFFGMAAYFAGTRSDGRFNLLAACLILHLVILVLIWMLDPVEFNREHSSVRFFSVMSLLFAALFASVLALRWASRFDAARTGSWFWSLIALAFVVAALDDYFALHELAGQLLVPLSGSFGLPRQLVQDGITVLYGVGAVVVIALFWRFFQEELLGQDRISGRVFISAIAVYGLAVINDTLDQVVESWVFPADPGYAMNFLEEALEFTAAVLFACSFAIASLEQRSRGESWSRIAPLAGAGLSRTIARVTIFMVVAVALIPPGIALSGWSVDINAADMSPDFALVEFADERDGLDSVDELLYVDGLGLLVGNEGTGEILLFDDRGSASVFVSGLGSPDGIAHSSSGIAVADELAGKVMVLDHTGQLVQEIDGWESPEGLVYGPGGELYVADKRKRLVVRVEAGRREIVASALDGLRSPEQLAIDVSGNLYITDESARAVYRMEPGGQPKLLVGRDGGIENPESIAVYNGNVYVADSAQSAIYRIDASGRREPIINFSRKKDLAGIAFGFDGDLFIAVVSDYRPANRILRLSGIP